MPYTKFYFPRSLVLSPEGFTYVHGDIFNWKQLVQTSARHYGKFTYISRSILEIIQNNLENVSIYEDIND